MDLYAVRLHVNVQLLIVVAFKGHLGMDCILVALERPLWMAHIPLE